MDGDEALARQLQAEEEAALAAMQRAALEHRHHLRGSAGQGQFTAQVEDAVKKVMGYEDELAQAMALSVMPLEQLQAAADEACAVSAAMGEQPLLAAEDALAQELLTWFKRHFFRWVNNPPCRVCGSTSTTHQGVVAPSAEEAAHLAGRTEVYRCQMCAADTRFPRYNDPVKLLETRQGRCGEWANCFTLCCRAAGLEARLALDWGDHVWTEQWSEAQQKWVHLDPCEAAYDKPLLYEAGWGKKLSYVVAVGRGSAADVTRRYTRQYEDVQRRRGLVGESWLADYLRHVTTRLRADLAPAQRHQLEQRDALDVHSMLSSGAVPLSAADLALPGRQTGDAAWLAARGEDGSAGVGATAAAAAAAGAGACAGLPAGPPGSSGTRYRLAKDSHLQADHPTRLCGGAARASGENAPDEVAARAFDGDPHTKWLDFGGKHHNGAWLEYRLPADVPPAVLQSYALTSANDSPERDPCHVVLEAWSEGNSAWVTLDEQRSLHFPHRHHRLHLLIPSSSSIGTSAPAAGSAEGGLSTGATAGGAGAGASAAGAGQQQPLASRRFRLRVVSVSTPSAANSVQLACLDLYGQHATSPQPAQAEAAQAEQKTERNAQQGQQEQQGEQQLVAAVAIAAGSSAQSEGAGGLQSGPEGVKQGPGHPQQEAVAAPPPAGLVEEELLQGAVGISGPTNDKPQQQPQHSEQVSEPDNPWAALFSGPPA